HVFPSPLDIETIPPTDRARDSPEFQPPFTRSAPLSSDHTPILPDRTLVSPLTDEEFEASKPSDTRITSPHSTTSPDSTTPLSPDHLLTQTAPTPTPARALFYRRIARMAVRTQPAMPPSLSARVTEAMTLSPSSFRKRYMSSYETPSPSPTLASPQTLPLWKRTRVPAHREREETAPGDQQQPAPVEDTVMDEPLGLGFGAARRRTLELAEDATPSTFEIGDSIVYTDIECGIPLVHSPVQSLFSPVYIPSSPGWSLTPSLESPASLTVPTPIASPATAGNEGFLAELYDRSAEVRDEIFSQRFRLRSLEQEQERSTITFSTLWRPILALEDWAGQTEA
ncbi:hypothetical protein Tco_1364314, partial [Tanacetum coccineum]